MKKNFLQTLAPHVSMFIAFVVAMATAYLLVSHFQHTLLRAWIGSTTEVSQGEEVTANPTYALNDTQTVDEGCGCPFCCGLVE